MEKQELITKIIGFERRVNRELRKYSPDAWMSLNLTTAQLKSLFFIDNEGSTNFTKLAATLGVTSSNVTGIVDRLVEQQLVSRKENPEDRRVLLLRVTEKGKALLSGLREWRVKRVSDVLNNLSLEELCSVARGLEILARAAEAHEQENTANHIENSAE